VTSASKKEAQAQLTAARTRAQTAHERMHSATDPIDKDARELHYQRCVRELEEAINAYDVYDTGDD
jgi:hypothetical protein